MARLAPWAKLAPAVRLAPLAELAWAELAPAVRLAPLAEFARRVRRRLGPLGQQQRAPVR